MKRPPPTAHLRWPRVLGAMLAVAIGTWMGPEASAHDIVVTFKCVAGTGPSPTPSGSPKPTASPSPTPDPASDRRCTPTQDQRVEGAWTIAFNAKAGNVGRLKLVELSILSEDKSIASPAGGQPIVTWGNAAPDNWTSYANAPNARDLQYSWDTNALTPYNGAYTIHVKALSHQDQPNEATIAERLHVKVDNIPGTPNAPIASAGTGGIAVRWAPAPEPDFIEFRLWRARTESPSTEPTIADFTQIKDGLKDNKTTDDPDKPGAYWYAIQSVRKSVVQRDHAIASSLSDTSAKAFVVTPTPPPASATAAPTTPAPAAPRATPRLLPAKTPPVPDAPFSVVLPYATLEPEPEVVAEPSPEAEAPLQAAEEPQTAGRTTLLPIAIGAFLLSAALSTGRPPAR